MRVSVALALVLSGSTAAYTLDDRRGGSAVEPDGHRRSGMLDSTLSAAFQLQEVDLRFHDGSYRRIRLDADKEKKQPQTAQQPPSKPHKSNVSAADKFVHEDVNYEFTGVQGQPNSPMIAATIIVLIIAFVMLCFELAAPNRSWDVACAKRKQIEELPEAEPPVEKKDSADEINEEDIPVDPKRWSTFGFLLVGTMGLDFYFHMPGTFFAGEADKVGLGSWFTGLYLGASGVLAFLVPPLAAHLLQFMNAVDLLRIGLCFMVVVAVPQSLAPLFTEGSYFAAYTIGFRFLEGAFVGIIETCSFVYVLRLFKRKDEYTAANGMYLGARGLIQLASPPLGGLMYDALGMWGPYTLVGCACLLIVPFLRCTIGEDPSSGAATANAPTSAILKVPGFIVMAMYSFTLFFMFACMEVIWQPWLGTTGDTNYGFSPGTISSVGVVMSISVTISTMTIGLASTLAFGNLAACMIGNLLAIFALCFVGNGDQAPYLFPSLPVYPWIPYVIAAFLGSSVGSALIAFTPLTIEILERESGYPRTMTNGPMASIFIMQSQLGMMLGPTVGGALLEGLSASASALAIASLLAFVTILQLIFLRDYFKVQLKVVIEE